jgi:hypothetical protein
VRVVLPYRSLIARAADQEPQGGTDERKEDNDDDPRRFGESPGECRISPDHVHQSVDVYGKNGDCNGNTEHAISLAVACPSGDYSMPTDHAIDFRPSDGAPFMRP